MLACIAVLPLSHRTAHHWEKHSVQLGVALVLGVPVAIALGVRAPRVRAMGLVGIEAIFVDVIADDTGLGLYAPFAGGRVAVDVAGWYAGADARVERRWQIGAPDHTQWQASVVLGYTWETRPTQPMR